MCVCARVCAFELLCCLSLCFKSLPWQKSNLAECHLQQLHPLACTWKVPCWEWRLNDLGLLGKFQFLDLIFVIGNEASIAVMQMIIDINLNTFEKALFESLKVLF